MKSIDDDSSQTRIGLNGEMLHESDAVIAPGLSVHFYGKTVGLYSSRLKVGKGFTEMPVPDLIALVNFFNSSPAAAKLIELNKLRHLGT